MIMNTVLWLFASWLKNKMFKQTLNPVHAEHYQQLLLYVILGVPALHTCICAVSTFAHELKLCRTV